MKHEDFKIGLEFWIGHRKFLCTDIGTITVVAIKPNLFDEDGHWEAGPPYAVEELVFDENDLPACSLEESAK